LSITKKHRPSGEKVREWFSELVLMGKGEVKGEGRNLQFRIFTDKTPPPPPSDSPPTSDPPSGFLDDFRQELDQSSNAESTTYQGSQEKLDKLDNLDDFPTNQKTPVEVEVEKLLDINPDGGVSSVENNQILDELSNLSNLSQGDEMVGNTPLDDWSKQSSNLNKEPKIDLASDCHLTAQLIAESQQPLVNDPTEVVLDEPTSENVDDCGQCGQVWSDCPHPQTEEGREVEASVVNCGQGQDTYSEPTLPVEDATEVVVEDLTPNSAEEPDVEAIEEEETEQLEETSESTDQLPTEQQEPEQEEIVVGSVVVWPNSPAHWVSWAPFIVETIYENGMVKLEIVSANCLVPLSELILVKR
jgi:hypothetical protein